MATNRDLLKEAIADAKAVKETAIANAKAALEELLNPKSLRAVNRDSKIWERYQKHRADYLVFEGVKLIYPPPSLS
jgi:vacuolar-type H+-ATPase subunit H